jgi:hypothetical protein
MDRQTIKRHTIIKILVTSSALVGLAAHLLMPALNIDAIALGLLLLALAPWLGAIIKSLELPGMRVELWQEKDPKAVPPGRQAERQIRDAAGFYTPEGLTETVNSSGLVEAYEHVLHWFLLFSTSKQHTWLLTTCHQVFCVLDDADTRSSGELIQWHLPLAEARPVTARLSARGNPVVDLGSKRNWLYSSRLHAEGADLEKKITRMLDAAQGGDRRRGRQSSA